jgi:hypothetical protein
VIRATTPIAEIAMPAPIPIAVLFVNTKNILS